MGRAAEEQLRQADKAQGDREGQQTEPGAASSAASGDAPPPPDAPEGAPRRARGPDKHERYRRTWRERGDNPEEAHDWSDFDIGRVVRVF